MRIALLCALWAQVSLADGSPPKDFVEYEKLHEFDCNGPFDHLVTPDAREHGGFRYQFRGATVRAERLKRAGTPKEVAIGLLAGIKDVEPETQATLREFLAQFRARGVDAVLIGGDTGDSTALEGIYAWIADETDLPTLTVAGNMERGGAHNYAIMKARARGKLQLINMDVVRRYDGQGFDVVSLAGYHDRTYVHVSGACLYSPDDLSVVGQATATADDPVIFLAHGPPRQKGKDALDYVPDVGNVGDPALTELIRSAKISFGAFGHILEAAGRATDLAGKPLAPGKFHRALYVNQGSANPLPWKLNSGGTSYGLAAVLTLRGQEAKVEFLHAKKRAPQAVDESTP